jgi:hypothetical protein
MDAGFIEFLTSRCRLITYGLHLQIGTQRRGDHFISPSVLVTRAAKSTIFLRGKGVEIVEARLATSTLPAGADASCAMISKAPHCCGQVERGRTPDG